jgi:hypothetical protein
MSRQAVKDGLNNAISRDKKLQIGEICELASQNADVFWKVIDRLTVMMKDKNWRQVATALTILNHFLFYGSVWFASWAKENISFIQNLGDFRSDLPYPNLIIQHAAKQLGNMVLKPKTLYFVELNTHDHSNLVHLLSASTFVI